METSIKASLILAILVLASISMTKASARIHVRIFNKVPDKATLVVHCKSKDDDLGVQYIPYGGLFEWTFNLNHNEFFVTTLFFCGYHWHEKKVMGDAFDADRDLDRCGQFCDWTADAMGVHGTNDRGEIDYIYPWK
ncbi:hypothetical protein Droror1_Dr00023129 [Drosera rotundifolia]